MADETPTPPAKKGGRFTGDDLAKIVKPGGDLSKLGGKKLDDNATQQIIMQRILELGNPTWDIPVGEQGTVADRGDLAEIIVDALPAELRTDTVAAGLDLRPYLAALDGKPILHREATAWYLPDATATWTAHTGPYLTLAETRAQEDAVVAGAGAGVPVSTKYDPTKAGVIPTATAAPVVDPTTGQVSTPGVTVGPNGQYSFGAAPGAASPFTQEDMRQMVQGDHWTLEQAALAGYGDEFQVDIGLTTPSPATQGGPMAPGHAQTISTNDALSYLRTQLTPKEIHGMQLKLASAGYFDKLGNGGGFIDGVVDDNTQEAWKLLLKDSVIQNRSAPVILGEGLKSYREQTRTSRIAQLSAFDPGYTHTVANDYAQSAIGRNLSTDELTQLNSYLQNLSKDRAGYVAGAGNNPDKPLPNASGFDNNDLEQFVDTATNTEQLQRAAQRRMYRMRQAAS